MWLPIPATSWYISSKAVLLLQRIIRGRASTLHQFLRKTLLESLLWLQIQPGRFQNLMFEGKEKRPSPKFFSYVSHKNMLDRIEGGTEKRFTENRPYYEIYNMKYSSNLKYIIISSQYYHSITVPYITVRIIIHVFLWLSSILEWNPTVLVEKSLGFSHDSPRFGFDQWAPRSWALRRDGHANWGEEAAGGLEEGSDWENGGKFSLLYVVVCCCFVNGAVDFLYLDVYLDV